MEVGVKYRGWATLNDYGQIQFTPEQTGVHAGQKKLVTEGRGFSVYKTTKKVVIHMSVDREKSTMSLVMKFLNLFNEISMLLKNYEF